ncbi:TIGR03086 family metal-binding protein [Actinophytocola sp.]|uniref:TIGR03086 family metal-binding protein n=1 Tax=Actinophytocola sp. TaxID=1872138 RepID=UPI002D7E72EE|nr:TIGR03086 family metal-binding protein [Actinophytocola sp.]HET9142326.1 TIGR03086 family metal-binding protein [Actinophytocola sp.]
MDIQALDRRALDAADAVVGRVRDADLDRPTPCAGWDLRALLVHMAGNNNGFAVAAAGAPADPDVWQGVGLEADPTGAYAASARRVRAAFEPDDVLDRTFTVHGFGDFPGATAIGMHFIDYLAHGWDVAVTIGAEPVLDPELCLAVLRIGSRWPPGSAAIWGPGAPFGHPVPVADDAPPAHRMLGFLGRSPVWKGGVPMRGAGEGSEQN